MMEALSSSVTSVLTRATRNNIPEVAILKSVFQARSKSASESAAACDRGACPYSDTLALLTQEWLLNFGEVFTSKGQVTAGLHL
jgi:hypothetical protein